MPSLFLPHMRSIAHNESGQPTTQVGFTFSRPYLYNPLGYAGQPTYVDCASRGDTNSTDCSALRICVLDASTHYLALSNLFPAEVRFTSRSVPDIYDNFKRGRCNVIAAGQFEIVEEVVRGATGYAGNYLEAMNVSLSKEPLALATRDDDPSWSDFVNWVVASLMYAEEESVTQNSAANLRGIPTIPGWDFELSFKNALSAVGNLGEMYARHIQRWLPRQPVNEINSGHHPLIQSAPFGDTTSFRPSRLDEDSTIEVIRRRGWLRCGIRRQIGFAEFNITTQQWTGMNVDFCRAISAALFNGVHHTVDIREVSGEDRFPELNGYILDVLGRTTSLTMKRDVFVERVGTGFTFAPTTFYDSMEFGGIPQ